MSKFHVGQIATYIRNRYENEYGQPDLSAVNNLSRFLALYSIDLVLPEDPSASQRLIEITDGGQDRGIDAIAVDSVRKVLVLSQSKWRQNGEGGIGAQEMTRFLEGVRSLVGMKGGEGEPAHASAELRTAVADLLKTPSAKIKIITATTGNQPISVEAMKPVDSLLREVNDLVNVDPVMDYRHFGQAELLNSLTESASRAVDLDVELLHWGGGIADPLRIFYGRVPGAEIAKWYRNYDSGLFADNIRVVIPRSEINAGMAETIKRDPDKFGYYNNGIVILSNSVEYAPSGLINRDFLRLSLKGASIVNGAQTVSTLGSMLGTEWEQNLGQVFVLVRCVEVPSDNPDLARGITRYANTQNEVSMQDFSFLDEQQHRLAKELSLIGFEYIIRQGEQPSVEDPSKIIYLRDAAVALACANSDLNMSIIAKREVSRLFSQTGVEYRRLFSGHTDPLVLLRSVVILRQVDAALAEFSSEVSGPEFGVATHARYVLAHLVLQEIGVDSLKDPEWDLEATRQKRDRFVLDAASKMAVSFPPNSYAGNVFKNRARTHELLVEAGLL